MVVVAAVGTLVAVSLALWAAHYPAGLILREWFLGAVGTWGDVLVSLKDATPLIFTGLAAGVAFRAGVFNIGAQGQAVLGALAAVWLATRVAPGLHAWAGIPLALLVAGIGGGFWALIAAGLERWRRVPVVLSTILLNFVALQVLSLLLEGALRTHEPKVIQCVSLPGGYFLPIWFPMVFVAAGGYLHIGFFIALVGGGGGLGGAGADGVWV